MRNSAPAEHPPGPPEPEGFVLFHTTDIPRFTAESTPGKRTPTAEILAETVSRIRAIVEPKKIILFGSAARGEMRIDSDLDFLVVVAPEDNENLLSSKIRSSLHNKKMDCLGFDFDVVITTPEFMAMAKTDPNTVHAIADEEGKILYES